MELIRQMMDFGEVDEDDKFRVFVCFFDDAQMNGLRPFLRSLKMSPEQLEQEDGWEAPAVGWNEGGG